MRYMVKVPHLVRDANMDGEGDFQKHASHAIKTSPPSPNLQGALTLVRLGQLLTSPR